jgi:hypothetical protein
MLLDVSQELVEVGLVLPAEGATVALERVHIGIEKFLVGLGS